SPISRMASTQENTESNVYYEIAENRDQIPEYIEVTGDAEYMRVIPPPSNTTVASAPPAGNVMLTPNIANNNFKDRNHRLTRITSLRPSHSSFHHNHNLSSRTFNPRCLLTNNKQPTINPSKTLSHIPLLRHINNTTKKDLYLLLPTSHKRYRLFSRNRFTQCRTICHNKVRG
ncbi:hypothetical protein BSL78_25857, partial [Apostichopus japonicus]